MPTPRPPTRTHLQCCIWLRSRMRVESPQSSSDCMTALGSSGGGNTTGVDDLQISLLAGIRPLETALLKHGFQVTQFGVIDSATQGCDSIGRACHGIDPHLAASSAFVSLSWHSLMRQSMLICSILPVSTHGGICLHVIRGLARMIRNSRGWCMISNNWDALVHLKGIEANTDAALIPIRMSQM